MSCEECHRYNSSQNRATPCQVCPKPFLASANETAWEIFRHMLTQARVAGMGGVTGFDYSCLSVLFESFEVDLNERPIMLEKLQILGSVAVEMFNKDD